MYKRTLNDTMITPTNYTNVTLRHDKMARRRYKTTTATLRHNMRPYSTTNVIIL